MLTQILTQPGYATIRECLYRHIAYPRDAGTFWALRCTTPNVQKYSAIRQHFLVRVHEAACTFANKYSERLTKEIFAATISSGAWRNCMPIMYYPIGQDAPCSFLDFLWNDILTEQMRRSFYRALTTYGFPYQIRVNNGLNIFTFIWNTLFLKYEFPRITYIFSLLIQTGIYRHANIDGIIWFRDAIISKDAHFAESLPLFKEMYMYGLQSHNYSIVNYCFRHIHMHIDNYASFTLYSQVFQLHHEWIQCDDDEILPFLQILCNQLGYPDITHYWKLARLAVEERPDCAEVNEFLAQMHEHCIDDEIDERKLIFSIISTLQRSESKFVVFLCNYKADMLARIWNNPTTDQYVQALYDGIEMPAAFQRHAFYFQQMGAPRRVIEQFEIRGL